MLVECPACGNGCSPSATACPKCGHPFQAPAQPVAATPARATKTANSIVGSGCIVQVFALLIMAVFPFWPWTLIFGLVLFILASYHARRMTCSACGNPVAGSALLCPTCKAEFE